jgi:ParB family chromosome partitioning protein
MALTPQFLRANADVLRAIAASEPFAWPTLAEFAQRLGRDVENLRKTLKTLRAEGLVDEDKISATSGALGDLVANLPPADPPPAPPAPTGAIALEVPLDLIDRDESTNPRVDFDEEKLNELADSIRSKGVLQPILIRQAADPASPRRRVVAGERRWRAAQRAGLATIPAVYRQLTDDEAIEIALIENLQRSDLNYLEEANAFRRILDAMMRQDPAVNEAEAKRRLGERINRTTRLIEQRLTLLKLDQDVQARLILPPDDERHYSIRDARYWIAEANRQEERKAAKVLSRPELLVMAEIFAKCELKPSAIAGSRAMTAVGRRFDEDETVQALIKRRLLDCYACHWNDGRAYIGPEYNFKKDQLVEQLPGFAGKKRQETLHALRVEVLGAEPALELRQADRWATAALNGPFDPDPKWAAQREASKAADAERKAEHEARVAAEKAADAGLERVLTRLRAHPPLAVEAELPAVLEAMGAPLPWRMHEEDWGPEIVDATGEQVQIRLDEIICHLINFAAGLTTPEPTREEDEEEDEEPAELDGERSHQSLLGRQVLDLLDEEKGEADAA